MKSGLRVFLLLLAALGLTACQSYWYPEADFGATVNGAVRAQAVNPYAPVGNPNAKAHMDGVSAKATVDNYQKSFTAPARTGQAGGGSLISINSGMGTGSTGGIGITP